MFTQQDEENRVSYKLGNKAACSPQHFVGLFLVDTGEVPEEQQTLKEKGRHKGSESCSQDTLLREGHNSREYFASKYIETKEEKKATAVVLL